MTDKSIFFIWIIWYVYTYGIPPKLLRFLVSFYKFYDEYFTFCNRIIYPTYWNDEINGDEIINQDIEPLDKLKDIIKTPPKYEDKYLNEIRRLNKEWEFTEEEQQLLLHFSKDFYHTYIENSNNRIAEINEEIEVIENENNEDTDAVDVIENTNDSGDELFFENTLEDRKKLREKQISVLLEEQTILKLEIETDEGIAKLKENVDEQARQHIIKTRLDKLKNNYAMEKTPVGNVLMMYDKDRESFKYYSDCNIPYRYLEVVGRKYVKMFNCRPIFIDMEEELKLFEEKWDKDQEFKKAKEEEEKRIMEEATKNEQSIKSKKNVFAKFKNYNKDAGGKISMAAPPKNSIPNKNIIEVKDNEKILLKERANRYTYDGKFANFQFLKKVEKKVFNKRLGVSFADFKKNPQKIY